MLVLIKAQGPRAWPGSPEARGTGRAGQGRAGRGRPGQGRGRDGPFEAIC